MSELNLKYRVINRAGEVLAAFLTEGHAAAFIDSVAPHIRKAIHLEDADGQVIENIRFREKYPGYYGHAWAILDRIPDSKREELATRGFNVVDTGRVSNKP